MSGLITGKGEGNWGRLTIRTDGSILLENVDLTDIAIKNCDIIGESGENPIPFADRMNRVQDFISGQANPTDKLHAGHTHQHEGDPTVVPCILCGLLRVDAVAKPAGVSMSGKVNQ